MLDTLLDHFIAEWRVITGAPVGFAVCVAFAALVIFAGLEWFHSEKTETQDQRIALLEQENTSLQGRLDEARLSLKATAEAAAKPFATTAHLSVHSYGDARMPTKTDEPQNIFRWFVLRSLITTIDTKTGPLPQQEGPTVFFIVFEPMVAVGTLTVSSPDMKLPTYEVKEFNPRFAIVTFDSGIPSGTLVMNVAP